MQWYCFRRTSATLLVNNGADLQLKRIGGLKSSSVAEGYIDQSKENQAKTANMLFNLPTASNSKNFKVDVQPENTASTNDVECNFQSSSVAQNGCSWKVSRNEVEKGLFFSINAT